MFDIFVDLTEPICQGIDNNLASMTILDTFCIEAYVQEILSLLTLKIKGLKLWKAIKGLDDSYDPYKAAYGLMPTYAFVDPAIKQM